MKKFASCLTLSVLLFTACSSAASETSPALSNESVSVGTTAPVEQFRSVIQSVEPLKIGDDGAYSVSFSEKEWTYIEYDDIVPYIKIGDKDFYNLKHVRKITKDNGEEWNMFTNADDTVRIDKDKNSESFLIVGKDDFILKEASQSTPTEASLRADAQEYIRSFVNGIDFDEYSYNLTTTVCTKETDAMWSEQRDGFYTPTRAEEIIENYQINFVKYAGTVATADHIWIYLDASGNIENLYYYQYDVDWSACEVDQDLVEQTVAYSAERYAHQHFAYHLVSYEITNVTLTCVGGKIKISVTVDMMLGDDQGEFGALCNMLLG